MVAHRSTTFTSRAGSDRHAVKVRAWLGGRRVEQGLGAADPDLETTVTMTVAGSQNGQTKREASSTMPQARKTSSCPEPVIMHARCPSAVDRLQRASRRGRLGCGMTVVSTEWRQRPETDRGEHVSAHGRRRGTNSSGAGRCGDHCRRATTNQHHTATTRAARHTGFCFC